MDNSISTLIQLEEKIGHRQRLADGLSNPWIVTPTVQTFPHVQYKFLNTYTEATLAELEMEFLQADLDADGVLNSQEIKYWMEKHVRPVTEAQLKYILLQFDEDNDKTLDFEEFLNLCSKLGYKISPTVSLSALLKTEVGNEALQEEKRGQKSGSHPSSSGQIAGKHPEERSYCASCTLEAVENPDFSTGQGRSGKRPPRRQVSRRVHAQRSPGHTHSTIGSMNVRKIISYFEAQIQKLAKDSEIRRATNQSSQQRAIRLQALEVSKNSSVAPPAPPPLPAKPLYRPMKPTYAPEIQAKSLHHSNISNHKTRSSPVLLTEEAENSASRHKESKGITLKDKTDELHILKKSNEPSNANMLDIEPAQEAMETVRQLQRHSEPVGKGRKMSYGEKRLMVEQRPLALKTTTTEIASMGMDTTGNEPQLGLEHVFDKGPRGLNQNYFNFPKVYKGVKTHHASFTSKNKKID